MRRNTAVVGTLVLAAIFLPWPCAAQLAPERAAAIDSLVAVWVAANDVVGFQVAAGMGDEVVWSGAYGMADLEHAVPMSDSSRFRTASISKWMTATAALRLVELGQLGLDTPVQEHCRAYPEKRWPLTLRTLLAHRGGVRHYWGANDEDPQTSEERRELSEKRAEERRGMTIRYTNVIGPVRRFADDPLLFEPGTEYNYTSHGYRLVGCVLRGAADTPYNEVMETHVFGPAGMTLTRDDDARAIIHGRARGYIRDDDGVLHRSRYRDVSENLPAGGHVSTAGDLVRFALAWNGGDLISDESRAAQTARPAGAEGEGHYGFGIGVARPDVFGGRLLYSHSGSQAGTRTALLFFPESDVTIASMSNDENVPSPAEIIRSILEVIESR